MGHPCWRPDGVVPKSNATRRSELRTKGIHIFDTYAGAIGRGNGSCVILGFILPLHVESRNVVFFLPPKRILI